MPDETYITLECKIAAILAAGAAAGHSGGITEADMWQRYLRMLTIIRANGGAAQPGIKGT